jgi:2-succinyl-5-enolpyruvyl-6-hydroxy-3-cyclohexene-1-carboxylate synthase
VNPSTAFATVLVDELIRCGLREAVVAPGSRSAPLAIALHAASADGRLRLHVRIDERSAGFLALGLAKASSRPVVVVCTSGTAAAHFHAPVIEADESGVPLLVLTADRPPELRGTGSNQTIDQVKLYGDAVRWFCDAGVPEDRPGQAGYWRSMTARAWAQAAGDGGGCPGPVHLNLPFRDPLVPDSAASPAPGSLPEALAGRPDGAAWTAMAGGAVSRGAVTAVEWTERGVVLCGDGTADPDAAAALAEAAGWPLLAEPSSGARRGTAALSAYQYLLDSPEFLAAHRPDVIISAGRAGLTRGQQALLRGTAGHARRSGPRHVVLSQGPGRWSDPARSATVVADGIELRGGSGPAQSGDSSPSGPVPSGPVSSGSVRAGSVLSGESGQSAWLRSWRAADAMARMAADTLLTAAGDLSEPLLARSVPAALPDGGLLWVASSMPARDLDRHMEPRSGLRVLASRGASGIDGLVSSAIGAALAHQSAGGGPAVALLGDLAVLHDAPGLMLGPAEPRPDLCLIVVNNDGGGIFSALEQSAFPGPFERVFGTPHGTDFERLAGAAGLPYARLDRLRDVPAALAGSGLRMVEVRTDRDAGTRLRSSIGQACAAALAAAQL